MLPIFISHTCLFVYISLKLYTIHEPHRSASRVYALSHRIVARWRPISDIATIPRATKGYTDQYILQLSARYIVSHK